MALLLVRVTNGSNLLAVSGGLIGSLIGSSYTVTITNSYYLSNQTDRYGGDAKDTIVDIIEEVEKVWDELVWDFINPDRYGNPLLII